MSTGPAAPGAGGPAERTGSTAPASAGRRGPFSSYALAAGYLEVPNVLLWNHAAEDFHLSPAELAFLLDVCADYGHYPPRAIAQYATHGGEHRDAAFRWKRRLLAAGFLTEHATGQVKRAGISSVALVPSVKLLYRLEYWAWYHVHGQIDAGVWDQRPGPRRAIPAPTYLQLQRGKPLPVPPAFEHESVALDLAEPDDERPHSPWTPLILAAGYVSLPNVVVRQRARLGLTEEELLLLLDVCSYPDGCRAAMETLAARHGRARQNVQGWKTSLLLKGLLEERAPRAAEYRTAIRALHLSPWLGQLVEYLAFQEIWPRLLAGSWVRADGSPRADVAPTYLQTEMGPNGLQPLLDPPADTPLPAALAELSPASGKPRLLSKTSERRVSATSDSRTGVTSVRRISPATVRRSSTPQVTRTEIPSLEPPLATPSSPPPTTISGSLPVGGNAAAETPWWDQPDLEEPVLPTPAPRCSSSLPAPETAEGAAMPVDDVTWTLDNILASEGWSDNDPERTLEAVHHLYRNAGLPTWQMCVALKQAADATRRRQATVGALARPIAYFMVALETTVHLQASLPAAEPVPAPPPADPVARDLWDLVQRSLLDVLPERVHTAYFRDAVGVRFDRAARVLDVQAGPGARARRLERWLTDVQHCATRAAGGELRVRFLDVDQSGAPTARPAPASQPTVSQRRRAG